jgi:hypothetical protein
VFHDVSLSRLKVRDIRLPSAVGGKLEQVSVAISAAAA